MTIDTDPIRGIDEDRKDFREIVKNDSSSETKTRVLLETPILLAACKLNGSQTIEVREFNEAALQPVGRRAYHFLRIGIIRRLLISF
jgi:hypothetical protein